MTELDVSGSATFGFLRDNPFIKNDTAHRRVTNFRQIRSHSPRNSNERPSFATVTLKPVQLSRPTSTSPMPPSNNRHNNNGQNKVASNLREMPATTEVEAKSHKDQQKQSKKHQQIDSIPTNANLLSAAKRADREERTSNGSNSEMEYGPGIVEKLRAKFTKLSGFASKTARVSSQVTCKRCPSVDDILSDKETHENNRERPYDTLDRNWGEVEKPSLNEQEPFPLMRGNSVDPAGEARRRYIVHRQVLRSVDDQDDSMKLPSISTLRRKFEESASRTNWENRQSYQTPSTLPVIRSQSAERSYSPSLMSPISISHSTVTSPCPEPTNERSTFEERRLPRVTSPPVHSNSRNHSPNHNVTSPRRVLSPEPQKSYEPRNSKVLREKQIQTQQRPRSMDVASEKAVLGKAFYPPRLRLSQPQKDQLWVLEVLNRAQPATQRPTTEDRSGRTMVRSATTDGIHERLLSPTQPTLMPPPRRPAPVIPEVSSGARVVSSHTVHPPPMTAVQPPTTLHLSHTLHRPTSDYRVETTTMEYKEEKPKPTSTRAKREERERETEREKEREIFISPPDPHSARDDRPALFSPSSTSVAPAADASPPPEEPKPPLFTGRSRSQPPTFVGPKILPSSNDISGKEEMKRLLSRFNATRDKKLFEEPNTEVPKHGQNQQSSGGPPFGHSIHTTIIQTYDQSNGHKRQQNEPFQATVTATHSSSTVPISKPSKSTDASRVKQPQLAHHSTKQSHYQVTPDNVTKITVRTESPAPPHRSQDGGPQNGKEQSPTRRPAPPPPQPPNQPLTQEGRPDPPAIEPLIPLNQNRKSLSAQFLEQQAKQHMDVSSPLPPPLSALPTALLSPKPYGDDATVRMESEDEGTEVSENGDLPDEREDSGERRTRASTSDSAVSVNSSQSEYSVEEEEPYGRKARYTFYKEETEKTEKTEKTENIVTKKIIERDFDTDSLEEAKDLGNVESDDEIPDEEAIERHLSLPIVEMPRKLQMPDMSDSEEEEEDEAPPLTLLQGFPNQSIALMAGDGNPVRNSLISLVMEEDIPLLLEAMSENPKFEFVDLVGIEPSTSSILHPPEKRKQRRTQRQVGRISFVTGAPQVFTYLDEKTAERENNWVDGTPVSYDVYQSICNEEQQEQVRQLEELERWKQNLQERQTRVEIEPDDGDCSRGVTSHLSYQTTLPDSARISV